MQKRRATRVIGLVLLVTTGFASSALAEPLVVSITFDDGLSSAPHAAAMLQARNMRATFFIIGGYLGHPAYLTPDQARALEAAGHEIGGHTVSHRHLVALSLDEAQREICNDRATLASYGLHPQSFAYPFGEANASVKHLVTRCGYNSARIVGPITNAGAPAAEQIPPADAFAIRTPASIESTTSLQEIEGYVTAAEATGGWLHLVFHELCQDGASCGRFGTTATTFGAVLDWLAARAASGTVVKLEREVIGGTFGALATLANPVMNPSLEAGVDLPEKWQRSSSGTNTATWTNTSDAHSGSHAQRVDITAYTSGSRQLIPALSVFAPPGVPGHRYQPSGWYKSSAQPRWTAYYRDQQGAWFWWTQSPPLPAASIWTQATWETPMLPSNATGLSFGLSLVSTGSLTVDDLELTDLGWAPTDIALTSPLNGASVRGTVNLTASATSPSGVARVDFLVDGMLLGSVQTPPYTMAWNSAQEADGRKELRARVLDGAGVLVDSPLSQVTTTNSAGLIHNPSLESDVGPVDDVPDCWTRVGFGSNTAVWTTTTDAHSGSTAQRVAVTAHTDGAQRLVTTQDSGSCAPQGVPGHRYRMTTWYKASAEPRWVASYRDASGSWVWWTQSGLLFAASAWTQSSWTTPELPSGATAISLGLSLYGDGALTVDDFTLFDATP